MIYFCLILAVIGSLLICIFGDNASNALMFMCSVATFMVAYYSFKSSKENDKRNAKEFENDKYKSICNVYDYLRKIIDFTINNSFNLLFYNKLLYNENFAFDIFNLKDYIFDNHDVEYLRKLNDTVFDYTNGKADFKDKKLAIKWLYKMVIDLCFKYSDLENNMLISDNKDMFLNSQLLVILKKLELKLDYEMYVYKSYKDEFIEFNYEAENINNIKIEKKYGNEFYMIDGNGYMKTYEPIFSSKNDKLEVTNEDVLYEGQVENYKFNGEGKYYYYSKESQKGQIDSNRLYEENAKKITQILKNKGMNERESYVINGFFENGCLTEKYNIIINDKCNKR